MIKQRRLLFLALMFLLISVGIVVAQSSPNYTMQHSVHINGGSTASANYKVNAVVGQPATGVVDSSNYKVRVGFLHPIQQDLNFDVWLPLILK